MLHNNLFNYLNDCKKAQDKPKHLVVNKYIKAVDTKAEQMIIDTVTGETVAESLLYFTDYYSPFVRFDSYKDLTSSEQRLSDLKQLDQQYCGVIIFDDFDILAAEQSSLTNRWLLFVNLIRKYKDCCLFVFLTTNKNKKLKNQMFEVVQQRVGSIYIEPVTEVTNTQLKELTIDLLKERHITYCEKLSEAEEEIWNELLTGISLTNIEAFVDLLSDCSADHKLAIEDLYFLLIGKENKKCVMRN